MSKSNTKPSNAAGEKQKGRAEERMDLSDNQRSWKEIAPFAGLSLICFVLGAVLLIVMTRKEEAELLVRLGLVGNVYYIVLLPLGLMASVFLFSVLQSYARYTGTVFGGTLQLGGPVIVFILVVILGFKLVQNPSPFSVTVYVHGQGGRQDMVLRDRGSVVMDLDQDRRKEQIGEKGQAYFPGIPADFRGQEVPIGVEATGFEPVTPEQRFPLKPGGSLYLEVQRKGVRLNGSVQDEAGQPVADAQVRIETLSTRTDLSGHFVLNLPGDLAQREVDLEVSKPGYIVLHEQILPTANSPILILRRVR